MLNELLSKLRAGVVLEDGKIKLYDLEREGNIFSFEDEDFSIKVVLEGLGNDSAVLKTEVRNKKNAKLRDIIVASLPLPEDYEYLKNGYQSWSLTRIVRVGKEGKKLSLLFPKLTFYARTTHYYRLDEPEALSHLFTAVKANKFCLVAGFLSNEHYHGYFMLRSGELLALNAVDGLKRDEIRSEVLFLTTAGFEEGLLAYKRMLEERFREAKEGIYGWCSWYYYYRKIDQKKLEKALKKLKELGIPVRIFQVDDGYQRAVGDWLELDSKKFRWSLKEMAERIKNEGFVAGLWIAPFVVTKKSDIQEKEGMAP